MMTRRIAGTYYAHWLFLDVENTVICMCVTPAAVATLSGAMINGKLYTARNRDHDDMNGQVMMRDEETEPQLEEEWEKECIEVWCRF